MSSPEPSKLLEKAIDGDQESLGSLLERYRPYLHILARRHLDSDLSARVDPSDIVQQTCLDACRDLGDFRGQAEGEFIAWLRRILENNARESIQIHVVAQKRSISREQEMAEDREGVPALAGVPADQSSASGRAMRGELAIRLAREIESLPDDQREAVRLRHLEGRSLSQLADHFGRSETAVAGLLKRGLRALRSQLADLSEESTR